MIVNFFSARLLKFALIGVSATLLHVLIVSSILNFGLLSAAESNTIAFVIATAFSYFLNTHWNFEQKINKKNAWRFAIVSLVGCGITYTIALVMDNNGFHYLIGIAAVVSIVPIYAYIMHSLWTYKV